uniref:Protein Wnt n=1 Tax=Perionyx excavatus TaxID=168854 RepID=D5LLM7_9ANNE|nr:WNT4a [Perionyx excavatus]
MQPTTGLMIALVLQEFLLTSSGIKWLSVASVAGSDRWNEDGECDRLQGLHRKQKAICRQNVEVMAAVREGAKMAIDECQHQFKNRRWNCSTFGAIHLFGKALKSGCREKAFVHAVSSAGVAHSVTRACSSGALDRCGCDRSIYGRSANGFEWAGCSDNIAYGSAFAKNFIDAGEKLKRSESSQLLMNLHNNNAGRKSVEDNMRIQCKCHGVSGSCELKTCWRSIPSFRDVGLVLKDKFDGATEVEQRKIGTTRHELVAKNKQYKQQTEADLVYLDDSPDFCEPDNRTGSLGTQGRLCNKTSKAIDGCELMCCGRGFNTRRGTVTERCNCKFHWCCTVKCSRCKRDYEEYVCR